MNIEADTERAMQVAKAWKIRFAPEKVNKSPIVILIVIAKGKMMSIQLCKSTVIWLQAASPWYSSFIEQLAFEMTFKPYFALSYAAIVESVVFGEFMQVAAKSTVNAGSLAQDCLLFHEREKPSLVEEEKVALGKEYLQSPPAT